MYNLKNIFGAIAVVLTFLGYFPYIRSILQNKTKPHLYTWFIFFLDSIILFGLQISHNAGMGAYVLLAVAFLCLTVLILTISKKVRLKITFSDKIFTTVALLALLIWLFAKQPLISAILIMTVDVMGFLPTVRKSWHKPESENINFYAINIIRFGFTLAALEQYSLINMLYPLTWIIGNTLFTAMLFYRRKK